MADATRDDDAPITGINVTPLVDVTLVLLIVFLVTAKAIGRRAGSTPTLSPSESIVSQGLPVTVPKVAVPSPAASPLVVTIDASGATSIDGLPVDAEGILAAATLAHARDPDAKAVIRASTSASHGAVVGVMDALRQAKVEKISFAVERR